MPMIVGTSNVAREVARHMRICRKAQWAKGKTPDWFVAGVVEVLTKQGIQAERMFDGDSIIDSLNSACDAKPGINTWGDLTKFVRDHLPQHIEPEY